MNKLSSFLGIALISFICACGNKSVEPKQSPIVGKWKLQWQNIKTYINDTLQVSSVGTTSDQSTTGISFGSDGNYTATAAFALNGTLTKLGATSTGYTGKYSATDSVITMDPFFIGTLWTDTLLAPKTAITYSNKIVTQTATITQLNSSLLSFETKIVIFQTADRKTRIITTKTSYDYTR